MDRLASLIQIVRALRTAATRGLSAHQDLKPDNIFFVDLHRKFPGAGNVPGLHFQVLVGDFGNTDAFREFGRNTGSRLYMAPEQFQDGILEPSAGPALDVFAIGVRSRVLLRWSSSHWGDDIEIWPRRAGVSQKWGDARIWRVWGKLD